MGGFSSVLGPAFVQDLGLGYNNTTWTSLAQAMSTAACAPITGQILTVSGGFGLATPVYGDLAQS